MVKFNSINRKIKKSFSLIELSICILISGLLTTLSVLCVDAVKQSRAQAIITQFETYRKAINNFNNDYGYLPGDLPSANYLLTPKEYSNSSTNDTSIRRIQMNGSGKGYIFNCVNVDANNYFYSDSLGVWSNLSAGGYIKERLSNFCYTSAENQTTCIVGDFNMPYAKYCEEWKFEKKYDDKTSNYIVYSYESDDSYLKARLSEIEYNDDTAKLYMWTDYTLLDIPDTFLYKAYMLVVPTQEKINNIEVQQLDTQGEMNISISRELYGDDYNGQYVVMYSEDS